MGARSRGATIMRHTAVTALTREQGAWRIQTNRGRATRRRRRELRRAVGTSGRPARRADLPIVPLEHHYVVTEPIDEVRERDTELPVLRDPAAVDARQEGERFSSDPFESRPRTFGVDGYPTGSTAGCCPRAWTRSRRPRGGKPAHPRFDKSRARRSSTVPTATPRMVVPDGPMPGLRDFFVLAGFSIFGIVFGGGAGAHAGRVDHRGGAGEDMWELDVRRLGPYASANGFLIPKASDAYLRDTRSSIPTRSITSRGR